MRATFFLSAIVIIIVAIAGAPGSLFASRIDELREKINQKNADIATLEKEIAEYEKKIRETGEQANTLANAIKGLDITRQKLESDIRVTSSRIESTNLNIERLGIDIGDKESGIAFNRKVLGEGIRSLEELDSESFVEVLISHDTFSDFWGSIDDLHMLQAEIELNLETLKERKTALVATKNEAEGFKKNLVTLQWEYRDRKKVADIARTTQNQLLSETKNKQSNYEKLLAEKKERKALFELEMRDAEAELKEALNPSLIPSAREGVLSWPLKNVIITQYFGNTEFATKNPSIYSGHGHNGIDLGAPIGTAILSAREGTIKGSGDTDAVCPNASYGKWIFVEHDNGLSTLYAHLSFIKGETGATVARGDIIGYTGNTGYSTGPHLHFTVFATDAVAIGELKSKICGASTYKIPLLTKTGGYLNPLSYLPGL